MIKYRVYENSYTWLIEHNLDVQGKVRLVVDVESADIMATLLRLKAEIEHKIFTETNVHEEQGLHSPGRLKPTSPLES